MGFAVRRPYLDATVLNQVLLDACADNLECRLEMVVDIERPDGGFIRASDRNKYVGDTFYEALLTFPVIQRTVGDWLSPEIQFGQLALELSNVDGRFNSILPGGEDYDSFVGRTVEVRIGLSDVASTYTRIFRGKVTEVGGVRRSVKAIEITARDVYDTLNIDFPITSLSKDVYPFLSDDLVGKVLPVIYGDYTASLDPDPAIVPAFVVNGASTAVNGGTDDAPDPTRGPVMLRICENDLQLFDTAHVYLKRSDAYILVPSGSVGSVTSGNKGFSITQSGSWVPVEGGGTEPYLYEDGDEFYVRVIGVDLGAYTSNPLEQVKHILKTYGGLTDSDFHGNWNTLRDKASPSQNAISLMLSRAWVDEPVPALSYALSILEQIRVEAFIDRGGLLKLLPLHFDEFVPEPEYRVKNWDVVRDTFEPGLDDRNNFNRAKAAYDYRPNRQELGRQTKVYRNQASIDQVGKAMESKILEYPNLYQEAKVIEQLSETLKLASALFEEIFVTLTWRALLLDVGDFVAMDVKIGSTQFSDIPCLIRDLGYDPKGVTIPVKLWSFQLIPFENWTPAELSGVVGGITASITPE